MKKYNIQWMFFVWLISCLGGLLWFSTNKLVEFDPKLKLSMALSDLKYEEAFINVLKDNNYDVRSSVIHFSATDCWCQTLAQKHVSKLSNEMQTLGFHNIYVNLTDLLAIGNYIPSTPALAVIDQHEKVLFLGPYSTGYGCVTASNVTEIIINKLSNPKHQNSSIITEAEGCYCGV
ncbi:MAG: hypothetical protein ACI88A_000602 [Paraglaciecola sp.]|jgi:hypothetical protein